MVRARYDNNYGETMAEQRPSIGRIIHYHEALEEGGLSREPTAAIIVAVHSDECVSLMTFPFGCQPTEVTSVCYSASAEERNERWCWPPRV